MWGPLEIDYEGAIPGRSARGRYAAYLARPPEVAAIENIFPKKGPKDGECKGERLCEVRY